MGLRMFGVPTVRDVALLYLVLGLAAAAILAVPTYLMLPCGYRCALRALRQIAYLSPWLAFSAVSSSALGIQMLILRRRPLPTWVLLGGSCLAALATWGWWDFGMFASLLLLSALGHYWCLIQLWRLRRAG